MGDLATAIAVLQLGAIKTRVGGAIYDKLDLLGPKDRETKTKTQKGEKGEKVALSVDKHMDGFWRLTFARQTGEIATHIQIRTPKVIIMWPTGLVTTTPPAYTFAAGGWKRKWASWAMDTGANFTCSGTWNLIASI